MTEQPDDAESFTEFDDLPARRAPRIIAMVAAALVLVGGGFVLGRVTASSTGGTAAVDSASAAEVGSLLTQALDLHAQGKVGSASTLYQQILEIDPRNQYALYNLGLIAHTSGNHDEAVAKYLAAIDVDPNFYSALYNLGLVYADDGDAEQAVDYLQRAVDAEPSSAGAHFNLGTQLIRLGRSADGEAELEKAYELDPSLKP